MQRPHFVASEIYHVFNRGVEKRDVFLTDKDYLRFIHSLAEFNDASPSSNLHRLKSDFKQVKQRELLVEVLCFCLMPNHYHLLLRQITDNGITEFMRKLGTGYTNYFNTKNERVGPLFQGKFKAVHVSKEAHLLYLPHYIHLNPLDLKMPEWREKRVRDTAQALAILKSYRWSSYMDYTGNRNYSSVIQPDFLLNNYYGDLTLNDSYAKEMKEWLKELDFASIQEVIID